MLCLGRMFLIPLEAHSFALPPPKQCAAGNKCFSLVDKSLISPLSKQSVVDKDCFSLAAHLLVSPPPIVLWFRQRGVGLSRLLCALTPWNGCKNYRKHSACGMKFVETCHEGCLKKSPPHKCEGASLTWMSFYLLNQMLITTEID